MSEKQFSRRHVTAEAFLAYQEDKEAKVERWRETMADNEADRAKRSDKEQLALIATRRGESKKERARLLARVAKADEKAEKAKAKKNG